MNSTDLLTYAHLKNNARNILIEYYGVEDVIVDFHNISGMLCGINRMLCKEPFSKEFLSNVAYNSIASAPLILFLQYDYLTLRELF